MPFWYPEVWAELGFSKFRAYDEPIQFDELEWVQSAADPTKMEADALPEALIIPDFKFEAASGLFGNLDDEADTTVDKRHLDFTGRRVFTPRLGPDDQEVRRAPIQFSIGGGAKSMRKYRDAIADPRLPSLIAPSTPAVLPDVDTSDTEDDDDTEHPVNRVKPDPQFMIIHGESKPSLHLTTG